MCKRIVSIICIVLLLGVTGLPAFIWSGNPQLVYADTDELSDQQKSELAVGTYYNARKGWFTGSSSASVIACLNRYIQQFFGADVNTTSIKSYSDFATHITVAKDNQGHWSVSLDNEGVTFLDHLTKWLLGKNEFPNLHSGGSWGTGQTLDQVFIGKMVGGNLVYFYDDILNAGGIAGKGTNLDPSKWTMGNYIFLNGEGAKNLCQKYISPSWDYNYVGDPWAYPSTGTGYTLQFYPGQTYVFSNTIFDLQYTKRDPICPRIKITISTNAIDNTFYCENGINSARGEFVNYMYKGNNNTIYSGVLTYYPKSNTYAVSKLLEKSIDQTDAESVDTNFSTDDFDHEDQAPPNSDGVTYTPKTNNGGTTNNYYDNDTINNFYNNYFNDYRREYTTINNNSGGGGSDPDPDPDPDPVQPGGTTPPWTDNNQTGAGTLTPNGSDGFNLSLPDLTLPDLNIDWSINGLKEKFPFSIPWDLMGFFTVLNAEPETPYIEGTIDLKIVQWEIDWNLHQFDNLARLLRNLEFIGFCIALIIITRNMIKG